ncbi:hypothetical protein D1BOALGB6SA_8964 [Olavius sp. associated proteobacterium Delta 1]|nr:hypothetical protein D1BOALGB6SA_8964 [Olavius sp. associated proteobacterium Delta 1]
MSNIRQLIIDLFIEKGEPVALELIASEKKTSKNQLISKLKKEPLLEGSQGLTVDESYSLIRFYGEGFLFEKETEKLIIEFHSTRNEIKKYENRALGKFES